MSTRSIPASPVRGPTGESYFEAIVETVREPLIVLDRHLRVRNVNRSFHRLFGGRAEDIEGCFLYELGGGEWDIPGLRELLEKISPANPSFEGFRVGQRFARLGERTMLVNARLVGDGNDPSSMILLAIDDVTEYEQALGAVHVLNAELESRVDARTTELAEANAELEAFAYSVSHDLRAPLRAIDGFSRIVLEDYLESVPEEARRYLDLVRENTQRMGELIDALLALSRLGRQTLDTQPVDAGALVADVIAGLESEIEGRSLEIEVGELPLCRADPVLLRQVFANLVSNAIKYTAGRPDSRIEVGFGEQRGEPAFFVRDNGVGFDMRYADKLFGVFQRLHAADEYEGNGVGLAVVNLIVRRHGGRAWAESRPDAGATFFFTLGER